MLQFLLLRKANHVRLWSKQVRCLSDHCLSVRSKLFVGFTLPVEAFMLHAQQNRIEYRLNAANYYLILFLGLALSVDSFEDQTLIAQAMEWW